MAPEQTRNPASPEQMAEWGALLDELRETLLEERQRYKMALRRITNTGFSRDCRTIARVALNPLLANSAFSHPPTEGTQ